ncbi:hypothetical protein DH2020_014707 [Rehmannia glutinosa]|uniref:Transmembrane protein n=1 Tax=Rehmannia glutinosa TaxID=99300 RepID=A0ABR0WX79_REHGL
MVTAIVDVRTVCINFTRRVNAFARLRISNLSENGGTAESISQCNDTGAGINCKAQLLCFFFRKVKSIDSAPSSSASGIGYSSALSTDQSRLLLTRPPRYVNPLLPFLCAICFVAGIFVGYTLKRRVRRWASKLLRRLKDD